MQNALVFGSMAEYLDHFGTTVEDYRLVPRAFEGEKIVGCFRPFEDPAFHTSSSSIVAIEGKYYQHVNWGEEEYALIPEADLMATFWTVYDWMGERFEGYESTGEIFCTEVEARVAARPDPAEGL